MLDRPNNTVNNDFELFRFYLNQKFEGIFDCRSQKDEKIEAVINKTLEITSDHRQSTIEDASKQKFSVSPHLTTHFFQNFSIK